MADLDLYESEGTASLRGGDADEQDNESGEALGPLLDLPEDEAAKEATELWSCQDELMSPRLAQWQVNALRREGVPNVILRKDADRNRWAAWTPPGRKGMNNVANKAAVLCNRLVALLMADPPTPEVVPSTGDDQDADSAEFSTRVLLDLQSEANDGLEKVRDALDLANTYGSAFIRENVDPHGKRVPKAIMASMQARTVGEALLFEPPYVTRYVKPLAAHVVDDLGIARPADPEADTGHAELTDDPKEAEVIWAPRLRSEVLTGKHVRMLPPTADDVWDADGVVLGAFRPWSELVAQFPVLRGLDKHERDEAMSFRPENAKTLLPGDEDARRYYAALKGPHALAWVLTVIYKPCFQYPEGCFAVFLGDKQVLHRETWDLPLPLTQFKQFNEGRESPYGVGLMERVGPAQELYASLIGYTLDHYERFSRRRWFVPTNSIVQPHQLEYGTASIIPVNPGGTPTLEEVPALPRMTTDLLAMATETLNDVSGLQETAQGLQAPNVQSAKHAAQIVGQVQAGLSDLKQNAERGLVRWWRLRLELVRTYFDIPQRTKWVGDDGLHKERMWSKADLTSEVDCRIKLGSFTMLTPSAKADLAAQYQAQGFLDAVQAREVAAGNIGGTLGIQDDPQRLRIRRQLAQWAEGPRADTDPAMQLQGIFQPLLSDEEPEVAPIRRRLIGDFMAGTRFEKHPPEWRAGVEQELQRMKTAMETAAQQAAMQQAAANGQVPQAPAGQAAPDPQAQQAPTPADGTAEGQGMIGATPDGYMQAAPEGLMQLDGGPQLLPPG